MTTPVLIAVFVALAIVMAALGGWTHHNRRRTVTDNRPERPPLAWWNVDIESWPGTRSLAGMMQNLGRDIYELKQQIKLRDENIMALEDDIIAQLAAAKTRDDGFRVLLRAIKDNQNNPAKLAQIAASISENGSAWTEAFAENVPPEPPAE